MAINTTIPIRVVTCTYNGAHETGLPLSRLATSLLADLGVESARRHMERYGNTPDASQDHSVVFSAKPSNQWVEYDGEDITRHDPRLVAVIRTLGPRANRFNGSAADINIYTTNVYGQKYTIRKRADGQERVVEPTKWVVLGDRASLVKVASMAHNEVTKMLLTDKYAARKKAS